MSTITKGATHADETTHDYNGERYAEGRPGGCPSVELVVEGRARDLGGLVVRRVLPSIQRRLVGPFIFFDHMGPVVHAPGEGIDVRPHPHIHLATVTYLFEGEIVHKDSLGNDQAIRPGAVNWMTAGEGIVHSERTGPERRREGGALHGIQAWVALPKAHENDAPSFHHHEASALPEVTREGARLRVLVGTAFGVTSPVVTTMPTLYVEASLEAGTTLDVARDVEELAAYVAVGAVTVDGVTFGEGSLVVFRAGAAPRLVAKEKARVMLLGGAAMDGPRFIFWNFVSSEKESLEAAKRAWREDRFPKVPGDDQERIPLPE